MGIMCCLQLGMKQDYTDLFLNGKIMVTLICWIRFTSVNPPIVYDYFRCSSVYSQKKLYRFNLNLVNIYKMYNISL